MNERAMFNLGYGLYVLSAREGEKDNGCIINTAMQVTSTPNRISITINKQNYTHDMIIRTGMFNLSVLTEQAPFSLFQHFGFRSGRDCDKFADWDAMQRSENGVYYLTRFVNAYLSGKVVESLDLGTHTHFIADVIDCDVLSTDPSVTYAYYHGQIKPKPQPAQKRGWICKICGYIYEGDPLPADFVCPICKHGAADFEPLADVSAAKA